MLPSARRRESVEKPLVLPFLFTNGRILCYNWNAIPTIAPQNLFSQQCRSHFFGKEGVIMMYRKSQPRMQLSNADLRLQRRVLLITCAVLLTAAVVLTVLYIPSSAYRNRVQVQSRQRLYSTCSSAIDEVNRLGSIVTSSASSRIGRVRQYIYYMEQLNDINISLEGKGASLVPDDVFPTLYSDLETLEELILQSTSPTLDARSQLLTHLQTLQAYLNMQ